MRISTHFWIIYIYIYIYIYISPSSQHQLYIYIAVLRGQLKIDWSCRVCFYWNHNKSRNEATCHSSSHEQNHLFQLKCFKFRFPWPHKLLHCSLDPQKCLSLFPLPIYLLVLPSLQSRRNFNLKYISVSLTSTIQSGVPLFPENDLTTSPVP